MVKLRLEGNGGSGVKAVRDLQKALESVDKTADSAGKELTKAQKDAERLAKQADPTRRYESQLNRLANAVQKGGLELDKAENLARRYGDQLARAGERSRSAFGARAIGDMKSLLLQYASANALLQTGNRLLQEQQRIREEAGQKAVAARSGIGALAQLAATKPDPEAAMRQYEAEAHSIRARGGADDVNEAANLLFELDSAGLSRRERDFAVRLKSQGVSAQPGRAAQAYAALEATLGREETGSFQDVYSKSLAASVAAPATAAEIVEAAARSGGSAEALGLNDEGVLAGVAILAKARRSASEGGTQLAAFLKKVEKGELGGGNIIDVVKRISALPDAEKGIGGVLGDDAEAVAGFRTLEKNIRQLEQLRDKIFEAERTNLARRAVGLPSTLPSQAAAIRRSQSEGGLEVSRNRLGTRENIIEAANADRQAFNEGGDILDRGVGAVEAGLWVRWVVDELFPERRIRSIAEGEQGVSLQTSDEARRYLRNIDRNTQARTTTRPE